MKHNAKRGDTDVEKGRLWKARPEVDDKRTIEAVKELRWEEQFKIKCIEAYVFCFSLLRLCHSCFFSYLMILSVFEVSYSRAVVAVGDVVAAVVSFI